MIYASSIKFYDPDSSELQNEFGFIYGDTYSDALKALTDWYGEIETLSVKIEVCSPDNILRFGERKNDFKNTKKIIEEEVIW